MPHKRPRTVHDLIKKKLKFNRVLALQGARQTGKSFLAREILSKELQKSFYVSLDSKSEREFAERSPQTFLTKLSEHCPVMIDEAQKAPSIFDEIKLQVDVNTAPGQYILLGSTEFSREVLVKESLTGRLGRIRIFPMSFREALGTKHAKPSRTAFLKHLDHGGMPGITFVRDATERKSLVQDWLNTLCFRDLLQFKKLKLDGELALEIFEQVSVLENPTLAAISKATHTSARRVESHLKALEQLFAIYRLHAHSSMRSSKPIFLPLDSSIVTYFSGSFSRKAQVSLLNERLCLSHYSGDPHAKFFYYHSRSKRMIHLLEEQKNKKIAFQILEYEDFSGVDLELMRVFLAQHEGYQGTVFAPITRQEKIHSIKLKPWEALLVLD
ncbi:MAG: ATP-binding protein [Xanthomonadaceae bacterium]|nr:ATP-binding protein [Xanthomonadaceae bacterium]